MQGVTKALNEYGERETLTWLPEAVAATAEEYRAWKVNPEGASTASPQVRSQLDRIEAMLARLLDNLGIPLADLELMVAEAITEQAGMVVPMTPFIRPEGGLGMRPVAQAAGKPVLPDRPYHSIEELEAAVDEVTGKPDWAALYSYSDHDVPEDAEATE